jgi:uncharacterized cupredoxin-like copper-binding protein
LIAFGLTAIAVACSGGGSGREISIVAIDSGCSPALVQVSAGEKITFVVDNQASGDRELEGIDGTRLEEVLIPKGRQRKIDYTAPSTAGTQKLKCYIPGGPSTIIEVNVTPAGARADVTVEVVLTEFAVSPSVNKVKAGAIRFDGKNQGGMIHELAVLSVGADGSRREVADVENIDPGKSGEFTVSLQPGRYELVCLIAPGEAGSTVDHYQQGMHTAFTVE